MPETNIVYQLCFDKKIISKSQVNTEENSIFISISTPQSSLISFLLTNSLGNSPSPHISSIPATPSISTLVPAIMLLLWTFLEVFFVGLPISVLGFLHPFLHGSQKFLLSYVFSQGYLLHHKLKPNSLLLHTNLNAIDSGL